MDEDHPTASDRSGAITRRRFCQGAALGLGGLAFGGCINPRIALPGEAAPLLLPTVTGRSVEVCLNSRTSRHGLLGGVATDQQTANVLWAAGRAPVTGSYRTIYLKNGSGTYVYDPQEHALEPHSNEAVSNALRINYDRERDFDAGVSYMCALLASVSLWDGTRSQLASCPQIGDLNFGIADVSGITDAGVAASSDGSLPVPATDGTDKLEAVLAELRLHDDLEPEVDLTAQELSQLLWAGYGCTPHTAIGGRAGLTVPSWVAQYFLTNRVYVVAGRVTRYCNRRGSDFATRDHRLEVVQDADARAAVRQVLPDLPAAPCYLLLCLTKRGLETWYHRLETGFVAGGVLLQAGALGLGCAFQAALSPAEQAGLQEVTQIPAGDYPHAVVAVGHV